MRVKLIQSNQSEMVSYFHENFANWSRCADCVHGCLQLSATQVIPLAAHLNHRDPQQLATHLSSKMLCCLTSSLVGLGTRVIQRSSGTIGIRDTSVRNQSDRVRSLFSYPDPQKPDCARGLSTDHV